MIRSIKEKIINWAIRRCIENNTLSFEELFDSISYKEKYMLSNFSNFLWTDEDQMSSNICYLDRNKEFKNV